MVNVTKIASMLEKATENTPTVAPRAAPAGPMRFARDPGEFNPRQLSLPSQASDNGRDSTDAVVQEAQR